MSRNQGGILVSEGPRISILDPMHGGQRVRVILELEPGGPVRGVIVGADDERQAFYGWLELAAALERLRLQEADSIAALD